MKDELTISKITTEMIKIPLERPFITHLHTVNAIHAIRVKIRLKNGLVGIGAQLQMKWLRVIILTLLR